MFGANKTFSGGFGTAGGQSAFGTPGFGQQQNTGGGLFGSTNTAAPSGGGLFGSNTGFGTNAQQNTGFGGFGNTQTANTGGSLFGGGANTAAASNTSNLFGTPASSTAFGAKTPGTGFGGGTTGGSLFGNTQQTSTGGLFGSSATSNAAGTLFGTGTTGGFGASSANGTTVKFNPPSGTDTMLKNGSQTTISTRHQCITAMKDYEAKSLEELRMEDYAANRKGPQQGSAGLFGATQNQTGFGGFSATQNKPATGGFGGFGATSNTGGTGLFGGQATQPQTAGVFGAQNQQKSLFGATTTTTASTGFGFNAAPAASTGTSLFGNTQKPGGLFGGTSQASGGLFGQTQTSTTGFGNTGGFGNTQTSGGLFGNKTTGFGAPSTSTGLGFGQQPASSGGLFGSKPAAAPGFGVGQASTGFGTQNQTANMFGNKTAGFGTNTTTLGGGSTFGTGLGGGTSLFGNTQNKPTGVGTGFGTGFGQLNTGFGGGLGTTNTNVGLNLGGAAGNTSLIGQGGNSNAQQAQINQQLMALAHSPYGDSPLFRNLRQDESKREEALKPTNPAAQKAALSNSSHYKVNSRPTVKIKPKPLRSIVNGKAQLFDGLEDDSSSFGNDTLVPRKSIKKLVIKPKTSPGTNLSNNNSLNVDVLSPSTRARILEEDESLVIPSPIHPQSNGRAISPEKDANTSTNGNDVIVGSKVSRKITTPGSGGQSPIIDNLDDTIADLNGRKIRPSGRNVSRDNIPEYSDNSDDVIEERSPHPANITLNRPGYFTLPAWEELAELIDDNGDCIVDNFAIGRIGYGNVLFPGDTNIAGMNFDEIVHFRRKEITIYPDDEKKPEVGEGLNKRAQVTLDCVFPNDKSSQEPITSPERLQTMSYAEKIERATHKMGATFIDYRPETGSWVFEVKHFSKYGLLDESDDDDAVVPDAETLKKIKQAQEHQLKVQKMKVQSSPTEDHLKGAVGHLEKLETLAKDVGSTAAGDPGRMAFVLEDDDMDMPDCQRRLDDDEDDLHDEDFDDDMDEEVSFKPSSHRLASHLGVNTHSLQVMKASFFGDYDMDIEKEPVAERGLGGSLSGALTPNQTSPLARRPLREADARLDQSAAEQPRSLFMMNSSLGGLTPQKRPSPAPRASPMQRSFLFDKSQYVSGSPHKISKLSMNKALLPEPANHVIIPSGMTSQNMPKKVIGSRVHCHVPPLEESLLGQGHERLLMDQGLFQNRACRVGWGPGLSIVHCAAKEDRKTKISNTSTRPTSIMPSMYPSQEQPSLDSTPFQVTISKLNIHQICGKMDRTLQGVVERTLEVDLKLSRVMVENGKCPFFTPEIGVEGIHLQANLAQDNYARLEGHIDEEYARQTLMIWDLCVALWGHLDQFPDLSDLDPKSYDYHQARRLALSQWLSNVSQSKIMKNVQESTDHINSVFSYLTGRQISQACSEAQKNGDHRLALILSQSIGSASTRNMMKQQLAIWAEQKSDEYINEDRLKVYTILAGFMHWTSTLGKVNVCENLDWKRSLAVYLWYHCSPTATLNDALKAYELASMHPEEDCELMVAPPLPSYREDNAEFMYEASDNVGDVWDMCYHLMKLLTDKTYPLNQLLSPTTVTSNQLDIRLSWHVWQALQALQYRHLSDYHSAVLTTSYAAQLENSDMWHWAIFVLLHLTDDEQRKHAVMQMLERHVSLESDEEDLAREQFLKERLEIPAAWIHNAKAKMAKVEENYAEEAWHLLKAGRWNQSHKVLLEHVTADAIINEEYSYLLQYLDEMSTPEHSTTIEDWDIGGKFYLDYITMIKTLDKIKKGNVGAHELEKLQPEVLSLCSRIGNLHCPTAKHSLSQAEIAKNTSNLLRTLMMLRQATIHPLRVKHVPTELLATHITALPMSEEYALEELEDLVRSYLLESSSS